MTKQVWRLTIYGEWEYHKQIQALNRLSEKGLQLWRGGMFCSGFTRDDQVRYVYQMDYRPEIENEYRYMELFAEMGWEYLNRTRDGWHFFRKCYQENMLPEEKEIYTDQESVMELHGRLRKRYQKNSMVLLFWPIYIAVLLSSGGPGPALQPLELLFWVLFVLGAVPLSIYFLLLLVGEWRYRSGKRPWPLPSKKIWILHLCLLYACWIVNLMRLR